MSKFNVGDEVVVTNLTDFGGLESSEAHELWGDAIGQNATVGAIGNGDIYILDPVKTKTGGYIEVFHEDELALVKRYTP